MTRSEWERLKADKQRLKGIVKKLEQARRDEPDSQFVLNQLSSAKNQLDEVEGRIADGLAELGDGRAFDDGGSGGSSGDGVAFLSDQREQLDRWAGSGGVQKIGKDVELGEAISRESVLANIGWAGKMFAAAPFTETTDLSRKAEPRGILQQLRRRLRLIDLIPSVPIDGSSIDYVQEGGSLSDAAEQVEGVAMAATEVTFVDKTAWVETVANYTKVKRQALADVPAMTEVIQSRLMYKVLRKLEDQLLNGTGHSNGQIQGILTMSGIGDLVHVGGALKADEVLNGVVAVMVADAEPNVIALNPTDWAAILSGKATDGHYFSQLAPFIAEAERLWSVVTVPSNAVTAGDALVGDTTVGATVFVREGVRALISDSDQDDFIKLRATIAGVGRFGVSVDQPSAWCKVNFT
jgi:HK97 family phage major capsid protein